MYVAISFVYLPLFFAQLVSKHHSTKTSLQVQESEIKNLRQKNEEYQGNITVFQEQLEKYKQDIQEIQESYDTSLTDILKLQAELETFRKENEAQLFKAAKLGDLELVKHLLKLNTSISAIDRGRATPLHWAAHNGQVEVVQFLLDAGANTEVINYQGNTPLIWAAHNGHERVCRALLEHGAKVNVSDQHRNTPIHYAAMFGYLPIVQLLIQYGADKTIVNEKGRTPEDEAIRTGKQEVAEWLMIKKPEHSTISPEMINRQEVNTEWFVERAANGDYFAVSSVLKNGFSEVSSLNSQHLSALHMAALQGHKQVVKLLVDAGANLELQTKGGNTPLIWAAHNNHIEICRLLLEHGAKVNVANVENNTALHYAAMFGYFPLVQMLVQNGANVSAINNKGLTPKGEALRTKEFKVVFWLSDLPGMFSESPTVTVDPRSRTTTDSTTENSYMPVTAKLLQNLLASETQQSSTQSPEPVTTVYEDYDLDYEDYFNPRFHL
ncbi:hypothetical protein C0J52_00452 [Blattella germanica]|nr:hypothetical protein C0J52_00452 [Blattella germanica]